MKAAALLVLAGLARVDAATELTSSSWDDATSGKSVFVKFLAPWCGHCKTLKPVWDDLASEYQDSKDVIIADVDCTTDGKSLCEKHGVSGYPTIKYGDAADLKDYNGGRTLDDLKSFAAENLGPSCGPDNLDLCDEADKKQIAKFMKFDVDELSLDIEEADAKIKYLEKDLEKTVTRVSDRLKAAGESIENQEKKKKAAISKATKKSGLAMMKMVKNAKAQEDPDLKEDL